MAICKTFMSSILVCSFFFALSQAGLQAGYPEAKILLTPIHPPGSLPPYPPETILDGQMIKLPQGGHRIWLELQFADWDSDHDGGYYDAWIISAIVDAQTGFAGSNAVPPNNADLTYAFEMCSTDEDCRVALSEEGNCPSFLNRCAQQYTHRYCEYAFLGCADYFFLAQLQGSCGQGWGYNRRFYCAANEYGVPDPGHPLSFGRLALDIPAEARGKYTIPFVLGGYTWFEWWGARSFFDYCYHICPFESFAAIIFVGDDCNDNVVLDELDISSGVSLDVDADGIPDECEPDCQVNGVPDDFEISSGVRSDCNANQIPDECDAADCPAAACMDCNANGTLDACDLASGAERDINVNGVPDSCEGLIPAVSTWGLTVMVLTLLIAAKILPSVIWRRSTP